MLVELIRGTPNVLERSFIVCPTIVFRIYRPASRLWQACRTQTHRLAQLSGVLIQLQLSDSGGNITDAHCSVEGYFANRNNMKMIPARIERTTFWIGGLTGIRCSTAELRDPCISGENE